MLVALLAALVCPQDVAVSSPAEPVQTEVFVSGEGGYNTYRIPAVVQAQDGTLLAFCEGRKGGRSDTGNIDLLLRRSKDGGATWGKTQVVWDDGDNTCGNPCPVVDRRTGAVHLLMTWNGGKVHESRVKPGFGEDSRRVFVAASTDHGVTWSVPREITRDVKRAEWTWYATGPGAGIQLVRGERKGRLVIPCDHKEPRDEGKGVDFYSHVFYSDDGGRTWQLGGRSPRPQVNECEVVELQDGWLLLNMRNYDRKSKVRQVCISEDGGATWKNQRYLPALVEPICQASLRRLRWRDGEIAGVILFSNPASESKRERMTVRASFDGGETWPQTGVLHAGSSAYSCLVALGGRTFGDDAFGCLYERDGYSKITFARCELDWLQAR